MTTVDCSDKRDSQLQKSWLDGKVLEATNDRGKAMMMAPTLVVPCCAIVLCNEIMAALAFSAALSSS